MPDEPACVFEAGEHILSLEPRISRKDGVNVVTSRKHVEDVLDRQAATAQDWLTPEYIGIHNNSSEQIGLSHSEIMIAPSGVER